MEQWSTSLLSALKCVLLACFLSSSANLQAQLTKGAFLLDGIGGFSMYPELQNSPGFAADPSIHYFMSSNWTIGGGLHFDGYFESGPQFLDIRPELRYYFKAENPHRNWFFFLTPRWEFLLERQLDPGNPVRSHFDISGGAGLSLFLTPDVVLQTKASVYLRGRNDQYSFSYELPLLLESGLNWYLAPSSERQASTLRPAFGRGGWSIGGVNPKLGFKPQKNATILQISLTPQIGYFLSDHWLVGLGIPFWHSYSAQVLRSSAPAYKIFYKTTGIGIIPFARLYPGKLENRIRPFLSLEARYATERIKSSSQEQLQQEQDALLATVSAGVNIFTSPNVAVEAGLYYSRSLLHQSDFDYFGLQWGLQFFLPPGKKR